MDNHIFTSFEIKRILDACKGKKLSEIDKNGVLERAKDKTRINGIAGDIIEESVLGYAANSDQNPDLQVDGEPVELKTTGLKHTKVKPHYAAKERLTITAVSPKNIIDEKFENSHFWGKAKSLLFVYYFYDASKPVAAIDYGNFIFQGYKFFKFSNNDKVQLQSEWEYIKQVYSQHQDDYKTEQVRSKLRGLNYLEVVAKKTNPRIALSQKYFNVIVHQFFGEKFEPILKGDSAKTFEEVVLDMFRPFIGRTRRNIAEELHVEIPKKNAKSTNPTLARKMLNLGADIENSEEFQKANIIVKTMTVKDRQAKKYAQTKEGFKVQHYFDFEELMDECWKKSRLRGYLFDTKFLLVIFQQVGENQVFRGAKFWQVPLTDLDGPIQSTWDQTRIALRDGVELTYKKTNDKKGFQVSNNLPEMSDGTVLHVRPDAQVSSYVDNAHSDRLPTPAHWINKPENMMDQLSDEYMTKQAFWLNPTYMYQQVRDLLPN
ncbi:MutH/Sau3AI family endonuclease [Levilactobacillus tongjiangensis]|uniref:MutH/Sau3AI family endonuclease n=1 Tax=Levilactobacillus tongjiangensis TaxID=2486023 RepID=A0ABW1SPI1_9LACO|nr:MutH/Sau3AI family endonuclease [Levilactobacillus tongjiangensis]